MEDIMAKQDIDALYRSYGITMPDPLGKMTWPNGLSVPYYLKQPAIAMTTAEQSAVVKGLAAKYPSLVAQAHLTALVAGSPMAQFTVGPNGRFYYGRLKSAPRGAEFAGAIKAACYGKAGSEKAAALLQVILEFGFELMPNLGNYDLRGSTDWVIPNCLQVKASDFDIVADNATLHAFGNARSFYFRAKNELCDGIFAVVSDATGLLVQYVTKGVVTTKTVLGSAPSASHYAAVGAATNSNASYQPIANGVGFSPTGTDAAATLFRDETGQSIMTNSNCSPALIMAAVLASPQGFGTTMVMGGYKGGPFLSSGSYTMLGFDTAQELTVGVVDITNNIVSSVDRVYTYLPTVAARYQIASAAAVQSVNADVYNDLNVDRYMICFNSSISYSSLLSSTSVPALAELLDQSATALDFGGVTAGTVANKVQEYRDAFGISFGPVVALTGDLSLANPDLVITVAAYTAAGINGVLGNDNVDVQDIAYTLNAKTYAGLTVNYGSGLTLAGLQAATGGADLPSSILKIASQYDSRDALRVGAASATRSALQLMQNLNPLYSFTVRDSSQIEVGSDIAFGCSLTSGRDLLQVGKRALGGPGGAYV